VSFAAAEAIRWIAIGINSHSFSPIGLALLALWTVVMAISMWRQSNLQPVPGREIARPISA